MKKGKAADIFKIISIMIGIVLVSILIRISSKDHAIEKTTFIQKPRYIEDVCFKYPTYVAYPIPGGEMQEDFDRPVWLIVRAIPVENQRETVTNEGKDPVQICGYKLVVRGSNGWSWMRADIMEAYQLVNCKEWGKVYPRNRND